MKYCRQYLPIASAAAHCCRTPPPPASALNKLAHLQPCLSWRVARGRDWRDGCQQKRSEDAPMMTVIGNVKGRRCIIVDDICDTAGTLCKAAETLMGEGAIEVHSYITHGVLSGPAIERISNSVMKHLVITDSIEVSPEAAACKKIRTVPLAPMLAQATLNIANGTSVSSLFDEDTLGPLYQGTY